MNSLVSQIVDVSGPAADRALGERMSGVLEMRLVYRGRYAVIWRTASGCWIEGAGETMDAALRRLVFELAGEMERARLAAAK